jgi:4-amino-4-deoxy-L-arabinose transferase-like glycosyltransferase
MPHWPEVGSFTIACLVLGSILLLYDVGRQLFHRRLPALLAALVYLNLVGVIGAGRSGGDAGILLWGQLVLIKGVLTSRRDWRWSWLIGFGLSAITLTEPTLGAQMAIIAIMFLLWDTPRLLKFSWFWAGVLLGLMPGAWLASQQGGWTALAGEVYPTRPHLLHLAFNLVQIMGLSLPWCIFATLGWQKSWQNLNWSWARFTLVWGGGYFLLTLFSPALGWSALVPLLPVVALLTAIALMEIRHWPVDQPYPALWRWSFWGLSLGFMALGVAIYINWPLTVVVGQQRGILLLLLTFIVLTLAMTTNLLERGQREFIPILLWGNFVCALIVVNSFLLTALVRLAQINS